MKQVFGGAAVATFAILMLPALAFAAPVWTSTTCTGSLTKNCASTGAPKTYHATVSAWSSKNGANFTTAQLNSYTEGFGVGAPNESTGSPQHSLDNNGGTDAILVNFGTDRVALNFLSTGWVSNDADVSILRYTGTAAPMLGSFSTSNLLATGGWELIGHYSSLTTSAPLGFNTGANAKSASWWLISAFDPRYSNNLGLGSADAGDDYFKLKNFSGEVVVNVPEPSTWMLFGVAMMGLVAGRRKTRA